MGHCLLGADPAKEGDVKIIINAPLMLAARDGHIEIVAVLLALGRVDFNQASSDEGRTALGFACYRQNEFALSKSPLLFKFVSNSFMSHGADISFLSVYPGEKEVLYPPLTYLRPIKVSEETIGATVYKIVEVEPVFPK